MATKRTSTKRATSTQPDAGSREQYLVAALRQLERQVKQAERDRSWNAAVNAKAKALQVRADLDQLRETQQRTAAPAGRDDHKAELLSEVRRLRVGATEAGSYVAAAKLLQLERDFVSLAEQEEARAKQAELGARTVADLEAEIEALRSGRPIH